MMSLLHLSAGRLSGAMQLSMNLRWFFLLFNFGDVIVLQLIYVLCFLFSILVSEAIAKTDL